MEMQQVQKNVGGDQRGKIVVNNPNNNNNNFLTNKPNIILHLKCKLSDLEENNLLTDLTYELKLNDIECFDNKEEILITIMKKLIVNKIFKLFLMKPIIIKN